MPNKKKRFFNKNNSVKYLLLPGSAGATNADGETLPTVLVPVSKGYKPGTSLLFSNIDAIAGPPTGAANDEADLGKIISGFDDDSDDDNNSILAHLKHMKISPNDRIEVQVEEDENGSFCSGQFSDMDEFDLESKYESTSATRDCPEYIKTYNERFEKLIESYDDDQIGALDGEEIGGFLTAESKGVDFWIDPEQGKQEETIVFGQYEDSIKEQILRYAEQEEDEKIVEVVMKTIIDFDCESILSTYSNKYNHPAVIKEESSAPKRITINSLKRKLTKSRLKQLDQIHEDDESESEVSDDQSVATSYNVRSKHETPEEKRERKNLFKEAKRESRMLKKENKLAFKDEKKLQTRQMLNAQKNRGIRLL